MFRRLYKGHLKSIVQREKIMELKLVLLEAVGRPVRLEDDMLIYSLNPMTRDGEFIR